MPKNKPNSDNTKFLPMKHRLPILLFLLLSSTLMAQWSVSSVPNTRLQSNAIHVSDPDNLISDAHEAMINAACDRVRDSLDIFVVALSDIGTDDSKDYATRLLNHWGIGDKGLDNGVLMLIVDNIHAIEIETGYGAEGLLPDAVCGRIIKDIMIPRFRQGEMSLGINEAVNAMLLHLGADTSGLVPTEVASYEGIQSPSTNSVDDADAGNGGLLAFTLLGMIWCAVKTFFKTIGQGFKRRKKKKQAYLHPTNGVYQVSKDELISKFNNHDWTKHDLIRNLGLIFICLMVFLVAALTADSPSEGSPILAIAGFTTVLCLWQNFMAKKKADSMVATAVMPSESYKSTIRSAGSIITMLLAPWIGWYFYKRSKELIKKVGHQYHCPVCGAEMKLSDDQNFSPRQQREIELESIIYKRYHCTGGHEFIISNRGKYHDHYSVCDACGARTNKVTASRIIRQATTTTTGRKENDYCCQNCGHTATVSVVIPRIETSSSSSSFGGGHSGGGFSSGGSFGGGHSGGGGASGRW
ncbi:MAG: TPM domain-containing protein [Bacteroidales bacterium]|nr:TPM domain-containing protein [Bacteroidales bacterium]